MGSVNSLRWDYKHSQEDTWKQLIIMCVQSVLVCVQYSSGTASVKWKMIDEKVEMVWEGELVAVMLTHIWVETSSANVKADDVIC